MPTIKIDGKTCEFEGKKTILQVALDHDIEIPHYCYHPGLSIVASCRICLAEVAQPNPRNDNKVELIPKLLPTCQTMAVDGAEVYTDSEKSVANQKAVMEYLLINHPLDCPVCDQAGECYLQDYSYEYGRGYSRFEEAKQKNPKKSVGDHVLLYSDRCIMCTRCVRFTREVSGTGELCVMGRGHKEEIDVFPGKALNNPLSANVVDICPVGALLDKDFLFEQRVWFLTSTPIIDGITASGDNLWADHNEGRIWRIKPRTNLDVNTWWTSDEIRYGWKFVHDEARLRTPSTPPIPGKGEGRQEVNWSRAYEAASAGLKKAVEANRRVALMVSPMLTSEEAYLLAKAALAYDEQAIIGVGPVPVHGEDQEFPGGYTIYAEKAPNARGVRRALELATGQTPLEYDAFSGKLSSAGAVILTGGYPSDWVTRDLRDAVKDKFTILIDILPNAFSEAADVLLPGASWVEKSGTFENAKGRLQGFTRAIPVIELAKTEGQIAIDLAAASEGRPAAIHDDAAVRGEMGGVFTSEVHYADKSDVRQSEMEYVEL